MTQVATILAFSAHPDDEVLLTGGTLARLAALIAGEHLEVLLSYDPQGVTGHRDHVRVHQVGARAAELAGSIRVLEATVPRELLPVLAAPARALRWLTGRDQPDDFRLAGTPRAAITHRISVRRFAAAKLAGLAAHQSRVRLPRQRQALSASSGSAQSRTISSSGRPRAAARAATVKNAGVAVRPVSILRSVSAGTPDRAAISAMLRGPRASRSSMPSRSPRACSRWLSGGRTMTVILIPV